jgi:hypothetical protein
MSWTHNTCFMTAAKYMRYWYHKKLSPYITDLYLFQSLIFLWSSNELLFYIGDALKLYCFLLLPWGWQFKLFHKMMFSWSEYALKYSINMTISSLNKCWWTLKVQNLLWNYDFGSFFRQPVHDYVRFFYFLIQRHQSPIKHSMIV